MKRLAFAVLAVVVFLAYADTFVVAQGTYTAADCSRNSVNAVINGPTHTAVDGDTINIPAGNCTWASGIVVPSHIGITIAGNGTPNSTPGTTGASSSCGSNTTLTLSGTFIAFSMKPQYGNSTSRLSCMVWSYSSGGAIGADVLGTCTSSGCPNLRMDNITFSNWAGHAANGISYGINAVGDMFGVVDHNTINGSSGNYLEILEQSNASYLGVGYWGDNSWAQPENYGSANFLFVENNLFNDAGVSDNEGTAGAYQNEGGGRIVARYNTFNITDNYNVALAWHGTESNGRPRSTRAYEFYENSWNCSGSWAQQNGCPPVIGARGGTGLVWGNTFPSGYNFGSILVMNTYRTQGSPSGAWGPCDGSTGYDTNDGTTYYSGAISSVSGNTITVSGSPGWTTNQWFVNGAPYSVHDVTQGSGAEIASNTSNTLTINSGGGPGSYVPKSGDSIQILRATACIDQAGGRGVGIMFNSANNPANVNPASEVVAPTYLWMNGGSATPGAVAYADTARVIQNRDYYMENFGQAAQSGSTSPFNGTTAIGMGHGTLANQPTTCKTGVGYWATDHGNWNQSGSGGQGELFLCTATNTWTLYYTPYAYPHRLTGGTAQSGPTNLQAIVH